VIKSPCNDVCRMDERLGLCEGCHRTLDEIARWSQMSDAEKRQVIDALANRRASIKAVLPSP
jgi:uncharacterized protein